MNKNTSHDLFFNNHYESIIAPKVKPKAHIFYTDLILTAVLGQACILYNTFNFSYSILNALIFIVGVFLMVRGAMFIHECLHQRGFHARAQWTYNVLFGFLQNLPSYSENFHRDHHNWNTFSTKADPEYDLFANCPMKAVVLPLIVMIFMPFLLFFRFGIMPLIYPFIQEKHRLWFYQHASSITHRYDYIRPIDDPHISLYECYLQDIGCSVYKVAIVILLLLNVLPLSYVLVTYLTTVITLQLNHIRSLANHRYNSNFEKRSKIDKIYDIICIEDSIYNFPMFPCGINYHVLHHICPTIPYYNLKSVHNELLKVIPSDHPYRQTIMPGLWATLKSNYFNKKDAA